MKYKKNLLIIFCLFLSLIISGCSFNNKDNDQNKNQALNNKELFSFNLVKPDFSSGFKIEEENIKPQIPSEKILTKNISNLNAFQKAGIKLTNADLKKLETRGFFLKNNYATHEDWPFYDDFVDLYNDFQGSSNMYLREPQNSLFITSDAGLHLFHVLVDRSFQKTEEDKFQPLLLSMTKALFKDSLNNYKNLPKGELKNSYKRLAVYYLVPLVSLESGKNIVSKELKPEDFKTYAEFIAAVDKQKEDEGRAEFKLNLEKNIDGIDIDEEIYNLAKQEIDLINEAKGLKESPLFTPLRPEFFNDYSQFKPRSHYTKNNVLKSYFIAMMWYGRMGFTLNSPELTRDALVITGQINSLKIGDKKISQVWSDMSSAIEFFVGESDDLTPYEFTTEIKKIYGKSLSLNDFNDNKKLDVFIKAAVKDLPSPRILSEAIAMEGYDSASKEELLKNTLQFRLMGQRFTPDADILNRLTQGDESADKETGQKLPSMPTALMVAHVLNPKNELVKNYLDSWINDKDRIKQENRESDKIIAKVLNGLNNEFSAYSSAVWSQNIYWGWLNSLRALLADYGQGYPFFMTNKDWQKKNLETVLGSYTELKHDTLLYAKQSYAEMGAGGGDVPLPPAVKGYVEPDLVFWDRLLALSKATRDGLKSRDLLHEEYLNRFDNLISSFEFFREIAKKELENKKISDADFEKLRIISSTSFSGIVMPLSGEQLSLKERRAGLIAGIHTDARLGQILYEANAKPYIIFVAVRDINGTRLTRGVIYNHYEFGDKLESRLNDEEWQTRVYDKNNFPKESKWMSELNK